MAERPEEQLDLASVLYGRLAGMFASECYVAFAETAQQCPRRFGQISHDAGLPASVPGWRVLQ